MESMPGRDVGAGWSQKDPLAQTTPGTGDHKSALVVFMTCFACLAPVWLLPGVYWDGWIYEVALDRGLSAPVIDAYRDNGRTLQGVVLLAFSVFDNSSRAANIAGCGAAALAGMFVYIILSVHLRVPRLFAGLAAVLGVIHPAYLTLISLSMIAFPLSLPLFWGGLLLVIAGQGGLGRQRSPARVFAGAGLVLVSFVGEVSVFMTPVLGAIWLARGLSDGLGWQQSLSLALRHSWWTPALSALGAFGIAVLFPLSGEYEGARLVDSTLKSYVFYFLLYIRKPLEFLGWGILVGVIALVTLMRRDKRRPVLNVLLILGAASFAFSIIPYVLAHRGPLNHGWQARFLLFSALPLGMMVSGFCMAIAAMIPRHFPQSLSIALPFVFFIAQLVTVVDQSLTWNARWLRDEALLTAASSIPEDAGLVVFDDRYPAPFGETLRWYEWQAIAVTGAGRFDLVAATLATAVEHGMDPAATAGNMSASGWSAGLLETPIRGKCIFFEMNSEPLIGVSLFQRFSYVLQQPQDIAERITLRRLTCPEASKS